MAKKVVTVEGVFDMMAIPRRLRNGDRMKVELEAPFDREKYLELAGLTLGKVKIFMEFFEEQPDLEGVDPDDED